MSKDKFPVTSAIRVLKSENAVFETYEYDYEDKGGTKQSAVELGVDEHKVIKTLIFDADGMIVCVLMHGDMEVSTKELARQIGVKSVIPCDEKVASNSTGYKFGGTSPFGLRKPLPIYSEESIFELDKIYINGGKQGFLIGINPELISSLLKSKSVNVAIKK
jgi:Cys-tRNA(Pro) deacylase